jgi:hypothetical protein
LLCFNTEIKFNLQFQQGGIEILTVTKVPRPKMMKLTTPSKSSSQDNINMMEEVVVRIQGIITELKLPPITKQTRLYVTFRGTNNITNITQEE